MEKKYKNLLDFLYHRQYFFQTWLWVTRCVSYKKQKLLTLHEHLVSSRFLGGSMFVFYSRFLCCVFLFCLYSLCDQCPMLPMSQDWTFLIALLVLSKADSNSIIQLIINIPTIIMEHFCYSKTNVENPCMTASFY